MRFIRLHPICLSRSRNSDHRPDYYPATAPSDQASEGSYEEEGKGKVIALLCFLSGIAVGALYAPVFKPLILKAWNKLQAFLNTPRE